MLYELGKVHLYQQKHIWLVLAVIIAIVIITAAVIISEKDHLGKLISSIESEAK